MTHPIVILQAALVAALEADAALTAQIGAGAVFDAPPKQKPAPYVVIDRHDVRQADGDTTPGQEHRVLIHCWAGRPSRRGALEIAERVAAAKDGLVPAGLVVTHAEHVRTETVIDGKTGLARAAVLLRFFTE
ncbi:Protein of unknown function [Devosia crocina]|uniref:DUF3168 domain-containing protein n=1 Tax=Devosia crocina TaxID=429728 RepID=A0A1I7NMI5_9HYPH|nr:DUF3168 domain-containing protein [Devosia crocina]SFV35872.1 Protein of unknown function [Devosia crocina]